VNGVGLLSYLRYLRLSYRLLQGRFARLPHVPYRLGRRTLKAEEYVEKTGLIRPKQKERCAFILLAAKRRILWIDNKTLGMTVAPCRHLGPLSPFSWQDFQSGKGMGHVGFTLP